MTARLAISGISEPFGLRAAQTARGSTATGELAAIVWSTGPGADTSAVEAALPGVEVRVASFDDPDSISAAFRGIERAVIPSTHADDVTRLAQHVAAVSGAVAAGVGFIGYTGVTRSHDTSLQPAVVHAATEAAIEKTGVAYCFLRNNMYTENELRWVQRCIAGEPLRTAAGAGRIGWASRDDYADAAARVLTGPGHEGRIYEFGGQPIGYADLADVVSQIAGETVPLERLTEGEYAAFLEHTGMAPAVAERVAAIQTSMARGELDEPSGDLASVLGRTVETVGRTLRRLLA